MLNQKADTEVQPRAKFNGLLVIVCNKWTSERSVHCLWNEWKWLFNYASAVEVVCSQATFNVGKIKMRVFILGALGFGWNCPVTQAKPFLVVPGFGPAASVTSKQRSSVLLSSLAVRSGPSWSLQPHKLHSSCSGARVDFEEGQLDILTVVHNNSCWIQARFPNLPHPAVPEPATLNTYILKYTQDLLTLQLAVCEHCGWHPSLQFQLLNTEVSPIWAFPVISRERQAQPEGDSSHSCRLDGVSWLWEQE